MPAPGAPPLTILNPPHTGPTNSLPPDFRHISPPPALAECLPPLNPQASQAQDVGPGVQDESR